MAKLDDVAIIRATQKVRGLTPRAVAAVIAIGQKIAPAAVLEMNSVRNVAVRQRAVSTT